MSGDLYVSGLQAGTSLQLFNVCGQQLTMVRVKTKVIAQVDMTGLQPGVYLGVTTGTDGESDSYKVIKK